MISAATIRRVNVEFLRPGPSHNQLLSPYTQYLAVCNEMGASVVTVPYEQRVFERRLKELRYETGDLSDRLDMLHEIGGDMGRILESVPGFTGAMTNDPNAPDQLVHLRLTLSAAELALLPFELAEVPVGRESSVPISVQTRPPVSVTRHIRTVSAQGLVWPERPRLLFVASGREEVPFLEHRDALLKAISPFRGSKNAGDVTVSMKGHREQFGTLLTILQAPTLLELQRECEAERYTHVHVLTHGERDLLGGEAYGIVLRDQDGNPDVVTGERFVSAVTRIGHRPSVVTIASCDSGNVGSVVVAGASFAHAVHKAGVMLVVGSQFPLSKEGSIPLTARLYEGLLWGEHPLSVLQQARIELHAQNRFFHDWASVVAYEALPPGLDEQLEALRYAQARRALDLALESIDSIMASANSIEPDLLHELEAAVDAAVARLPRNGPFGVECVGLTASSRKRLAQARFERARNIPDSGLIKSQYELLEHARLYYAEAVKAMLVNDSRSLQRKATLHWVLVQYVSLGIVLEQAIERGEWEAAYLAAISYLQHPETEQRAWAQASLAELWLLKLADASDAEERKRFAAEALRHADDLSHFYFGLDELPIESTRRQFSRYIEWWGSREFSDALRMHEVARRASWATEGGIIDVAKQIVAKLMRRLPTRPSPSGGRTPPDGVGGATPAGTAPAGLAGTSGTEGRTLTAAQPAREATPRAGATTFRVEALPAGHGDCLWIEYGAAGALHRILIDCGTQASSSTLLKRIDALPADERFFELFVLSHIDSDHIGGALPLFKAVRSGLRFGDVWFNGWRHISGQLGARQGEMFSTAILDFELPWNLWQDGRTILASDGDLAEQTLPGGMRLTVLSPTAAELKKLYPVWSRELKRLGLEPGGRVDYSRFLKGTPSTVADASALADIAALADTPFKSDNGAPNGTSIALLAEFDEASVLLAADAHAPVLVNSIKALLKKRNQEKLKLDLFKVSHHGSQNNVSSELISLLDCPRYLVSTNGDHFFHPDRQAMARILKYGGGRKDVYFNYASRYNEVWGSPELAAVRKEWGCTTYYPEAGSSGIAVTLR